MKKWTLVEVTVKDFYGKVLDTPTLVVSDGFYTMKPLIYGDGGVSWDRFVPKDVARKAIAKMNAARREGHPYHNDCRR